MYRYRKRNTFLLIIVILAIAGCKQDQQTKPPSEAPAAQPPSVSPEQPFRPLPSEQPDADFKAAPAPAAEEERVFNVKLAAVGDVLIHSSIYKDAKTNAGYDFKPMFAAVKPYIEEADIAMANQESMLGGEELGLADYPRFNSPYEVGDALKDAGFDVINLANNHTLDHGLQAVTNTISHLNDIGLLYTGAYMSVEDQSRIRTMDKNGISFAFLSYTYGTNGIPVPPGHEYIVNYIDLPKIRKEVAEARSLADVVVVNLHFGQEYVDMPSDDQKKVARAAVEAGAAIIIGHHPHVLQPAEWIETPKGQKSFVVYSLGNFIAAQEEDRERTGGIIQLEVEKTIKGGDVRIQVKRPAFIPTWIHRINWRHFKVAPLWAVEESQHLDSSSLWRDVEAHMKQWMPELQFREK